MYFFVYQTPCWKKKTKQECKCFVRFTISHGKREKTKQQRKCIICFTISHGRREKSYKECNFIICFTRPDGRKDQTKQNCKCTFTLMVQEGKLNKRIRKFIQAVIVQISKGGLSSLHCVHLISIGAETPLQCL